MDELSSSVLEFQDPYAVFLEVDREFISFNGSVSKLSWELPFSSSLLLFISALVENSNNRQDTYLVALVVSFHLIR